MVSVAANILEHKPRKDLAQNPKSRQTLERFLNRGVLNLVSLKGSVNPLKLHAER